MYNQYDQSQKFYYTEATKLAAVGEEFSHLIKLMNPDYALRMKIFVMQLPREVAVKTIYGRSITAGIPEKVEKKTASRRRKSY